MGSLGSCATSDLAGVILLASRSRSASREPVGSQWLGLSWTLGTLGLGEPRVYWRRVCQTSQIARSGHLGGGCGCCRALFWGGRTTPRWSGVRTHEGRERRHISLAVSAHTPSHVYTSKRVALLEQTKHSFRAEGRHELRVLALPILYQN